jgi:hypothetical protein
LGFAGPRLGTGRFKKEKGHVTYQSIGNFVLMKKTYTLRSKKGEHKPSQPKNGTWAPKSVWSCDIRVIHISNFYQMFQSLKLFLEDYVPKKRYYLDRNLKFINSLKLSSKSSKLIF